MSGHAPRHSDIRNAEVAESQSAFRHSERPLSLKKDLSPKLKNNLKGFQRLEMKEALYRLETTKSADEVRTCLEAIIGKAVADNDGGKWINRWRIHPATVHEVLALAVERLVDESLPAVTHPGGLAEIFWKKIKESLKNPTRAR